MNTIGQLTVATPGREHLGLERRGPIVHRRKIGVVVDRHQPQRGVSRIARQRERDVMRLLGVRLGVESRTGSAVRLIWIDVEGHVDRRQRDIASCRGQRRFTEAEELRNLALGTRRVAARRFRRSGACSLSTCRAPPACCAACRSVPSCSRRRAACPRR